MQDDILPFEDEEEEDEDYYPSLPFAALFSCLKVALGCKQSLIYGLKINFDLSFQSLFAPFHILTRI